MAKHKLKEDEFDEEGGIPLTQVNIVDTDTSTLQSDFIPPPKRFCEECQVLCPYRARHCHECNRCVRKFDHHCFWIGGCVGELNHGRFLLMLIFLSWQEIIGFTIALNGKSQRMHAYPEDL